MKYWYTETSQSRRGASAHNARTSAHAQTCEMQAQAVPQISARRRGGVAGHSLTVAVIGTARNLTETSAKMPPVRVTLMMGPT